MPTGYTSPIYEGKAITFEQFVWRCARAFGALVHMRDEPMDKLPPKESKRESYHEGRLAEATAELARLRTLSLKDAGKEAAAEYARTVDEVRASNEKSTAMRARYSEMLGKVVEWQPPTPEHVGLKDFMVAQLREAREFDCHERPMPTRETPAEWLASALTDAERTVTYHTNELAKDRQRLEDRYGWLNALRKSVPQPKAMPE